jgi:glutamate 5-kinase
MQEPGSPFDRVPMFGALRRVVVKVGSSTLQALNLDTLTDALAALRARGVEVALVTSGAVACGMARLGFSERPRELTQVQALAAIGQAELMARYQSSFTRHGLVSAQILLTHGDLAERRHFLNIRHTLQELLSYGVIPIANENDTVATDELRFGDNDRLAAAFGAVVEADLVVLLTDIPALYDRDPRRHDDARPLSDVFAIDDGVRAMAGTSGSAVGTGGMQTKVEAAEIATRAGIPLVIASGADPSILTRILAGEVIGTLFHPQRQISRRLHWIGFFSRTLGVLRVDAGAAEALRTAGASLLPIGVTAVEGHFAAGDAVEIRDLAGALVARGLSGYDSEILNEIRGLRRDAVSARLQGGYVDPVVHRNDLVLADESGSPSA